MFCVASFLIRLFFLSNINSPWANLFILLISHIWNKMFAKNRHTALRIMIFFFFLKLIDLKNMVWHYSLWHSCHQCINVYHFKLEAICFHFLKSTQINMQHLMILFVSFIFHTQKYLRRPNPGLNSFFINVNTSQPWRWFCIWNFCVICILDWARIMNWISFVE